MPVPLTLMPSFDEIEGFFVGLDYSFTVPHWRVYHNDCATDLASYDYDGDLGQIVRVINAHSCPPPMTQVEALDYAIFAVSNHTDPDASTEEDVARLEARADEIKGVLDGLRDFVATRPDAEVKAEVRPLSDFAIHVGLLSRTDRPTGLWIDGAFHAGNARVDLAVDGVLGLYLDGTWTEWGERSSSDPSSHIVYRLDDGDIDNFAAVMGSLLGYLRENSAGRLTDWAAITLVDDYAEKVGVIPLVDYRADPAIPSDWRTR